MNCCDLVDFEALHLCFAKTIIIGKYFDVRSRRQYKNI